MLIHLLVFVIAMFMVIRGSTWSTKYAAKFAEGLNLSKYTVGFIVIAIISILPETFISLNAALEGIPSFGLGMLLGSNVADLTLVFALVVIFCKRSLAVENKILKEHTLYPFILLLPIILGLDGHFSRLDGTALIIAGAVFYLVAHRSDKGPVLQTEKKGSNKYRDLTILLLSLAVLLTGAHLVVTSATAIATWMRVSPVIIGMLIVSLGTTMPELLFSIKSVRQDDDSMAVGDLLGTVLADATIVIGLLALISPFTFPKTTIYIGGIFMVSAAFILFNFMRSGHSITKREALALVAFWLTFILTEFIITAT